MKKITKKEVKDKRLSQVVSHLRLSGLKMSDRMLTNIANMIDNYSDERKTMHIKILEEHGLDSALRGMAYSFRDRAEEVETWWAGKRERAYERMSKLAHMDGGHNKALESIVVWIDIDACRGFHSQLDTYRSGITKQSDSTMHTLAKREPVAADFEEGTDPRMIELFVQLWNEHKKDVTKLKDNLPEGYLQRRVVCTNYKTLRNIIAQRRGHRLKYWDVFCDSILAQVEHPEYLVQGEQQCK